MTEERTMEKTAPADPAAPTSTEVVSMQAGQVWFPDSAHKTATAVNDFAGEELPLMIFANWRGFSGGQRDMYDEVLKFGALIVDALVDYQHPVFVYLPPYATLRGGAWAVLDPTINSEVMEMYADPRSRGGKERERIGTGRDWEPVGKERGTYAVLDRCCVSIA